MITILSLNFVQIIKKIKYIDIINIFNVSLMLILALLFMSEKNFFISMTFFILSYLFVINNDFKFTIFSNFILNIFYTFRIFVLKMDISQFYYEKRFYLESSFIEATYIIIAILFTFNLFSLLHKKLLMHSKIKVNITDMNLIFISLIFYFIFNIFICAITNVTIGFEMESDLKYLIRILQIFSPLVLLIFLFDKTKLFLLIALAMLYSIMIGSKAIFYNLLISYIVCSYLYDRSVDKKITYLLLITFISIPFVFLISDYIRYSEGMQIKSVFMYLFDIQNILSKGTIFLDRFAYFDTLIAWISHHRLNGYYINSQEYLFDFLSGVNRFIPGNLISFDYTSFENKTVYELKAFTLENRKLLGYYTESMGLAKFYFLGSFLGSMIFGVLLLISIYANSSAHILLKLFSFYFIYDVLMGTDMQSIFVIFFNFLILSVIFFILRYIFFNSNQVAEK